MRRIILEEPMSRAAVWSRSCATFSLIVAALGVIMARRGLDPTAAVAVEGGAVAIAVLAILFALIACAVIWHTGYRGTGRLLGGLLIAALVLAYPAYAFYTVWTVPPLPDVSTDLTDPPSFSKAARVVAERGGTPAAPTSAGQDTQRRLYPDLQPILLDMEALEAQKFVLKLLVARRWRILDETLPLGRFGVGHIDAVAPSALMGFPADVTVRIKMQGGQSRIDIRSVSRTKWHLPNSDAQRVQALAADIEDQADAK